MDAGGNKNGSPEAAVKGDTLLRKKQQKSSSSQD
jgi:hypothetical protein